MNSIPLFFFIISLNDDFIIIYRRYFTYVTQMVLLFVRWEFFIKNIILRLGDGCPSRETHA